MSNFKRQKCRRRVRCTMCTWSRWKGNGHGRFAPRYDGDPRGRKYIARKIADND